MSVLPGIIVLGGTILMCLVCLLASRRNNTCSFSYRNTNNVYVHRPQVIIENTVFSSGQDLPLDCSREIQPYKKEN
ncbi:RGD1566254 (predicted) [Rattus norvegicus]|uniref:RGD1566254 (Predicted) n=1 Tax=Rattus norvegicus TaxID=10116 RepID=A6I079_RAT|nr:RGD1566254 (predicted) [Rattus norvegicus]